LSAALAAVAMALSGTGRAGAASYYMSGTVPFPVSFGTLPPPGESQSTVVAPGRNSACPDGRVLVTNDQAYDRVTGPVYGSVVGHDLSHLGGPGILAKVNRIPVDQSDYGFYMNDHDIAALSDGSVILEWSAFSKRPLHPKPAWFDAILVPELGLGARRGMMMWRSTDCGKTFNYLSQIDPALVDDGKCAFPQFDSHGVITYGGTDGQLMFVDPLSDKLYVTMGCVGRYPNPGSIPLSLSGTPVDVTIIFQSTDRGATWQRIGSLPHNIWRLTLAASSDGQLTLGVLAGIGFGFTPGGNIFLFPPVAIPSPGEFGWGPMSAPLIPRDRVKFNIAGSTIIARTPGSNSSILVYPSLIAPDSLHESNGYRMYFFNRTKATYAAALQILPLQQTPWSAVMHLAAIDLGRGPVLLYWYDIDGLANHGTVRGRLVFGEGQYSDDFAISRSIAADGKQVPRFFNLTAMGYSYWYGDYVTAGGYAGTVTPHRRSYHYFPQWSEPDGTAKVADITVTVDRTPQPMRAAIHVQPFPKYRAARPAVNLKTRKYSAAERNAHENAVRRGNRSRP
jgi:hypothetical protein